MNITKTIEGIEVSCSEDMEITLFLPDGMGNENYKEWLKLHSNELRLTKIGLREEMKRKLGEIQ